MASDHGTVIEPSILHAPAICRSASGSYSPETFGIPGRRILPIDSPARSPRSSGRRPATFAALLGLVCAAAVAVAADGSSGHTARVSVTRVGAPEGAGRLTDLSATSSTGIGAGLTTAGSSTAAGTTSLTYQAKIKSEPGLVSYWEQDEGNLGEPATMADAFGSHSGAYEDWPKSHQTGPLTGDSDNFS